jgi:AcrR family transcriptional regulator
METPSGAPVATGAHSTPRPSAVRDRIVETGSRLFYLQGIRAVSADKIIAEVGITKVTFYRHFPTKDDLVLAYLERRAEWERGAFAAARRDANDAAGALRLLLEGIGEEACQPGFRGCPFINAATEYTDPQHPVRQLVDRHREWFKESVRELLSEIGIVDSTRAADEIVMLRDGAIVSAYLSDPRMAAEALYDACGAIVATHLAR